MALFGVHPEYVMAGREGSQSRLMRQILGLDQGPWMDGMAPAQPIPGGESWRSGANLNEYELDRQVGDAFAREIYDPAMSAAQSAAGQSDGPSFANRLDRWLDSGGGEALGTLLDTMQDYQTYQGPVQGGVSPTPGAPLEIPGVLLMSRLMAGGRGY